MCIEAFFLIMTVWGWREPISFSNSLININTINVVNCSVDLFWTDTSTLLPSQAMVPPLQPHWHCVCVCLLWTALRWSCLVTAVVISRSASANKFMFFRQRLMVSLSVSDSLCAPLVFFSIWLNLWAEFFFCVLCQSWCSPRGLGPPACDPEHDSVKNGQMAAWELLLHQWIKMGDCSMC